MTAQNDPVLQYTEAQSKTPDELLSGITLGSALSEAYSVPKVAIKTYKFSAAIGKGEWDFYLFNSVPAFSVSSNDSEQYVRNDLLRDLGGVLNVAMGRTGYFGNGSNPDFEEVKGARYEFKAGAKALDVPGTDNENRRFFPVLQSTLDFRYMIPLFTPKDKGDESSRTIDQTVGNLSFRFMGAVLYVPDPTIYNEFYSSRKGIPPQPTFFAGTVELYFYITGQLYINAGYSFSNQNEIKPIPYFSISYGKK